MRRGTAFWSIFAFALLSSNLRAAERWPIALVGGTLLDLSNFGSSGSDIPDSVVLLSGDRIAAAGPRAGITIPEGAERVDVAGKFVVPGLIDGFAGLNSQAQANAYLYMGVTSIVGAGGERRGELKLDARPSPHIYALDAVESLAELEAAAKRGIKVAVVYFPVPPELIRPLVERAKTLGVATIGVLGRTPYPAAIDAGIQAFVHTSRYSLELAPAEMRAAVAADPFGPPKATYYDYLTRLPADDPALGQYASVLGRARVGLIPTLSLGYLDLPGHRNLWKEPAASILDPATIHLPADPATGDRRPEPPSTADYGPAAFSVALLRIETRYRQAGARYLAGSGTSAFGTMPGISLHTELELLVRIGLTPRQALAAATGNFRQLFGWTEVGAIAPGSRADLLVLDGNPLEDLANLKKIRRLYLDGGPVDRAELLRLPPGKR